MRPPSPLIVDPARRRLLLAGAGLCGLALGGAVAPRAQAYREARTPFTLGIASGQPEPDGFVIWTRLAPEPYAPGGGLSAPSIAVAWEVAADAAFTRVLQRGVESAEPAWGYSLHVEVVGLSPGRPYWYRFRAGDFRSAVGRALTAPVIGAPLASLRVATVSCQHYEQGYFSAYRHLVADDPELVLHLGDYIYETPTDRPVRLHEAAEPRTLEQYRARYACYKQDADLQRAHAHCAWLMVADDHEVDNDYAGALSQDDESPETFLVRRAAAYQAYWEHQPLRLAARPRGGGMPLYGSYRFGDLLQLSLLDGRQYRDNQACELPQRRGGRVIEGACLERLQPQRSLLGAAQEAWLGRQLVRRGARWNVIAQQTLLASLDQDPGPGVAYWSDGWDGYPAARRRLLQQIVDSRVSNPLVLSGDVHSFWATELRLDPLDSRAPPVASEFVGTSISSEGLLHDHFARMLPQNPHIRFFDARARGYLMSRIDAQTWRTELRAMDTVTQPQSTVRTLAAFVVEAGRPGFQTA